MRVLVTGAAGCFAQALLPVLCRSAAIDAVTGIDSRAQEFEHAKFRAVRVELSDPAMEETLTRHDALVHLASAAHARASEAIESRVRPVHKLFQAAHLAGMRHLVHLSTAAVYGPAVHASEQSPLRPLAGFAYAMEQAQLEQLLAIDFAHCVRLRPHLIVGPHAHPMVRRFLRQPFYPRLAEAEPLFQCVHEEDLANAVLLSLNPEAHGAYNIATEESFTLRDAVRARRGFSFGVSLPSANSILRIAARYLRYELDPVWMQRAAHTVLINCRRAIIELGWRARYTAHQALAAT
jgi:nucleoside-diphosphate-sugar epimerase